MEIESRYRSDLCMTCGEISCTLNYEEALKAILDAVQNCLGADGSSLLLLDPANDKFSIAAVHGLSDDAMKQPPIALQEGSTGAQLLEGRVAALKDLTHDPAFEEMAGEEGLRSGLAAPLRSRGKVIGALLAFSRESRDFSADEASYLLTGFTGRGDPRQCQAAPGPPSHRGSRARSDIPARHPGNPQANCREREKSLCRQRRIRILDQSRGQNPGSESLVWFERWFL